jgi:hypothetical protein
MRVARKVEYEPALLDTQVDDVPRDVKWPTGVDDRYYAANERPRSETELAKRLQGRAATAKARLAAS